MTDTNDKTLLVRLRCGNSRLQTPVHVERRDPGSTRVILRCVGPTRLVRDWLSRPGAIWGFLFDPGDGTTMGWELDVKLVTIPEASGSDEPPTIYANVKGMCSAAAFDYGAKEPAVFALPQEGRGNGVGPCPCCGEAWATNVAGMRIVDIFRHCVGCHAMPEQRAAQWRASRCERCGAHLRTFEAFTIGGRFFCEPCHDAIMAETEAAMSGPEPRLPTHAGTQRDMDYTVDPPVERVFCNLCGQTFPATGGHDCTGPKVEAGKQFPVTDIKINGEFYDAGEVTVTFNGVPVPPFVPDGEIRYDSRTKAEREAWKQCTRHTAWDAKRQQGAFIPLDHRIDYVHQDQAAERAERLKPEPHPKTWPSHDVGPDWED